MKRYKPKCENETLFLVAEDDQVMVGEIDDILAAIGSDTYAIEYDEKQLAQPWLDTNDGVLNIDVRESVTTITHTGEFVSELREYDMTTERYGLPKRTVKFADFFIDILEQQGAK